MPNGSHWVALATQIIPQKTYALTPMGNPGFLRVLPQSQLVLEPSRHGIFESTRIGFTIAAHNHQVVIRKATETERLSGRVARHMLPCRLGVGDFMP